MTAVQPIRERVTEFVKLARDFAIPGGPVHSVVVRDAAAQGSEAGRSPATPDIDAMTVGESVERLLLLLAGDDISGKGVAFALYLVNAADEVLRGPLRVRVTEQHRDGATLTTSPTGASLDTVSVDQKIRALQTASWVQIASARAQHATQLDEHLSHAHEATQRLVSSVVQVTETMARGQQSLQTIAASAIESATKRAETAEKHRDEMEVRLREALGLLEQMSATLADVQRRNESDEIKWRVITSQLAPLLNRFMGVPVEEPKPATNGNGASRRGPRVVHDAKAG